MIHNSTYPHNFKDIYTIIKKAGAGFVVNSQEEFYDIADRMLSDKEFYTQTIEKCEKVFNEQQGALEFVINILKESN